ncbi:MAG: hypothetical protein M3Z85_22175, partial [Acidobacteriota bacterium]|nr:hypothetical protein [Acidobacteriota bacterium]
LLVIASGDSSRDLARRAMQSLDDAGRIPLGVILNRVDDSERRRYAYPPAKAMRQVAGALNS